jgi:hypothetical protein
MIKAKLAEADHVTTFGQRKIAPRACIADGKKHIRMFLVDALDELGFITAESSSSSDLGPILDFQVPDLVILGLSSDGIEVGKNLKVLAEKKFNGKVLLIGPRDSILVAAVRQLGDEFGIPMLPPLATPFSADGLRASLAMLPPAEAPPSPAGDVADPLPPGGLELW